MARRLAVTTPAGGLVHENSQVIRVHNDVYEQLTVMAAAEHRPRSHQLAFIIEQYFREHGYGASKRR